MARARDLSQGAYRAGAIALTDILDADRQLLTAQDQLAASRADAAPAAVGVAPFVRRGLATSEVAFAAICGDVLRLAAAVLSEKLNSSRVAERLAISQPALSKQIAELENRVGFTIFKRDQRQVAIAHQRRKLNS